jgi:metal-sulfur cluster biosynthetic enzyme
MVSKAEILGKLSQVMDPELGINIVDLGLIYGIDIRKKTKDKKQQAYKIRSESISQAAITG